MLKPPSCWRHRIDRELVTRGDRHPVWWCPGCRDRKSACEDTIFEDANLTIGQILALAFSWAHGLSYEATRSNLIMERGQTGPTNRTIAHWFDLFRDRIIDVADHLQLATGQIGGPGCIVQIDEALIGRRKYNRGRVVEGTWVLGMVASDGRLRLEKCPGNRRDRRTLEDIIQRHVAPGSVIHTDGWRAYQGLEQLPGMNYTHEVVNHNENFVAPSGAHTQRIESQWRALRRRFSPGGRRHDDIEENLVEYLWRRECDRRDIDPFASLIVILRQ